MKSYVFASAILAATLVSQPAVAQIQHDLVVPEGTFRVAAGSVTGGGWSADFNQTGQQDYLFAHAFAYRMSGDSREYLLSDPTASFQYGTTTFDATMHKGVGNTSGIGGASLRFDLNYRLSSIGSSPFHQWCMIITNVSQVQVDYSFFAYYDFDIPNAATNTISSHTAISGGWISEQSGGAGMVGTYALGNPNFQHGPLYSGIFTNAGIDNLNNSVNPGPGDLAMGFQWFGSLAPGQSSVCPGQGTIINGVVPEPSSIAVLGLGALGLLVARRRRSA